jgi:hypothetical protein
MEIHRDFPTSQVKIAVMTANRLHYSIPDWGKFKDIISDALDACPGDLPAELDVSSVLARLEEEFSKSTKGYGKAAAIIDIFRKVLDYQKRGESLKGKESEPFIIHCEAALIALAEFQDAFNASKDLSTVVSCLTAASESHVLRNILETPFINGFRIETVLPSLLGVDHTLEGYHAYRRVPTKICCPRMSSAHLSARVTSLDLG